MTKKGIVIAEAQDGANGDVVELFSAAILEEKLTQIVIKVAPKRSRMYQKSLK